MDTQQLAWAAGVFDGEGSASTYVPRFRRSPIRQIAVSQKGATSTPDLLVRFQAAVGGLGHIHGPYRGQLYYWNSKRHAVVDAVMALLWPYLSPPKRDQLSRCADRVGRPIPDASALPDSVADVAWSAGFFCAEGTISITRRGARSYVCLSVPQAALGGIPETLVRFRNVHGGAIRGPRYVPSPWSKRPQYRWQLGRAESVTHALEEMRPFMDVRRGAQADAALGLSGLRGPVTRQAPSGRNKSVPNRSQRPECSGGDAASFDLESLCNDASMSKIRTTVTLDAEVLKWVKLRAARMGRGDSEVIEDALRRDLGLELLDRLRTKNQLPEAEAARLEVEAQHATRPRRRG